MENILSGFIKMKYVKLQLDSTTYWRAEGNDDRLISIAEIFEEGCSFPLFVLENLQKNKGCGGNKVDIDFENNIATIYSTFDDPDERSGKIEKEKLIDLINQFLAVTKGHPEEIFIKQLHDDSLVVDTKL